MHNLKINGRLKAVTFSHDSSTLYATGGTVVFAFHGQNPLPMQETP